MVDAYAWNERPQLPDTRPASRWRSRASYSAGILVGCAIRGGLLGLSQSAQIHPPHHCMYPQIEIWIHAQFPAYYLNCVENLRPPYPANGAQIQLAVSATSLGGLHRAQPLAVHSARPTRG